MNKSREKHGISWGIIICLLSLLMINPFPRAQEYQKEMMTGQEWIVQWKGKINPLFLQTVHVLHRSQLDQSKTMLVQPKPNLNLMEWYERWVDDPDVQELQPNIHYQLGTKEESSSRLGIDDFYYLKQINMRKAWNIFKEKQTRLDNLKKKEITVAIVDTGVDLNHPRLASLLVPGVNVKNRSLPPQDQMGHGTKVAGVVAAVWGGLTEPYQIVGTGKIMPIKVLEDGTDGDIYFTVEGIREAIERHADIIVLAQGSWTYSKLMDDVTQEAERAGILVVSAAGNAKYNERGEMVYNTPIYYPAALPVVLGVGSVRSDGTHEPSSNYGEGLDLVAPGEWIQTLKLNGDTEIDSGTSFATPQVAAVAALAWQLHPDYSARDIYELLCQTAKKEIHQARWDEKLGFGQINPVQAFSASISSDASEPNQNAEQSMPISTEQIISAVLPQQDEDWYHLSLHQPGILHLRIQPQTGTWKDSKLIISALGEGRSTTYELAQQSEVKLTLPSGRVQLRLIGSNQLVQPVHYQLIARVDPEIDSFENNYSLWNASLIPLKDGQASLQATLHQSKDEDWYRVNIGHQGKLSIRVQATTPRFDPVIYLYNHQSWKGKRIDEVGEGEEEVAQFQVQPGVFYIRVSDYGHNIIDQPYQLLVDLQPDEKDLTEPNPTSNDSVPILFGQEILARWNGEEDLDWYNFVVQQDQEVTLHITSLQEVKQVEGFLYNQQLQMLQSWAGSMQAETKLDWVVHLPRGRYFLRIQGKTIKETVSYRLSIQ